MTLLALLAGTGLGFALGLVFGLYLTGKVLPQQFDFLSRTVDRLTASALYPGLSGITDTQVTQPQESMYETDEKVVLPDYLSEEDEDSEAEKAWDYTS